MHWTPRSRCWRGSGTSIRVFWLSPVCVTVVVLAATLAVVSPVVKPAFRIIFWVTVIASIALAWFVYEAPLVLP